MKTSIKKIAALLLALAVMIPAGMIGVFADDAATTPTGPVYTATEGWGDPDGDGVFEIATPGDLLALAAKRKDYSSYAGKTIVLTADIDMNPGWDASSKTAAPNAWPECFYMKGTFDGQGHTIKGLYRKSTQNASLFVLSEGESVIKNLKIENTYLHATQNGTGLFSAARGSLVLENIYMDAICVSDGADNGLGSAAGFVSWFNCSADNMSPSVTLTNCVFAGSVTGKAAAAFVGTNSRPATNKGLGTYSVTMTDCVNYGTITATEGGLAAGLIGECANEAVLTRCYNAGTTDVAFVNVATSASENLDKKAVTITLEDCYYLGTASTKATNTVLGATATVSYKYDGVAATEAKTATATELLAKNAFKASDTSKGWANIDDGAKAVPAAIVCLKTAHDYTSVVTAPTCATKGFTTFTCKNCNYTYEGDLVDTTDHTEGDWIVDKEATEEFAGLRHTECTVCQTTIKTEPIPQLPATETTAPDAEDATTAPADTDAETDATDTEKTGGCKGSIALSSALGMASIIGLGAIALGKKRR